MTIVTLIRSEFARLTASRMGKVALVALMTVPIVYGGLYLYGNENPYDQLNAVPAALVVQDTGTTVNGKTVNYGADTAKQLLKGQKFGWVEVSATTARKGITDGTYDFGLSFPASFSKNLASAGSDSPSGATLVLTTNDTNSYLSTTIAKQGAEAVRVELAKQVGEHASSSLLAAISSIRTGLVSASDGAKQLADGAATASTGAASLASGASSLSAGLAQLDARSSTLPSSASALSSGASRTASGASQTFAGAQQLRPALAATLAGNPNAAAILAQYDALTAGIAHTSGGAAQVAAGAAQLNASAPALASAVHSAAAGASTVASGAAELSSGTTSLASGSSTLSSSLGSAVQKIPTSTKAQSAATAKAIASPLAVKQDAITTASNYGAGLAPFFLSLAAWIGMYALFLLVRPLSRRALTAVRRPIRTVLAGWLTPALLGIVQMIALFLIVTLGLHLAVVNGLGMLAFMAFASITFAAIILALNVLLGSTGQFLGLLLMVIQLVTAGGTFPWQTLPAPLRALHEFLPMSHAVDGIRTLMYGGSTGLLNAILPLAAWLVGSLVVATLGARRQGKFRSLRELRPSPIGG